MAGVSMDGLALMSEGEDVEVPAKRQRILLYNGDAREARRLFRLGVHGRAGLSVALGLALLAAVLVAGRAAPWGRAASAARWRDRSELLEETKGKAATSGSKTANAKGGSESDGKDGEDPNRPPGCCSWDMKHCGEVKGLCRGGVKECEHCKGQWIQHHQGICEQGHSLESPLPTIWNYTSHEKKHVRVKVLSYNLYWWHLFDKTHAGASAGQLIKDATKDKPYDVMGFQECNQPYKVLWDAGEDGKYQAIHAYTNICIAWRKKVWEMLAHGQQVVAQDASWGGPGQNYGQRMAIWARLRHRETNETLFFMNHHGPLPLSSGGDWGGPETARKLLNVIMQNATKGEAVIFVGDFNSNLGSMTVKQVGCRLNKILSGHKFGGIDHIFANVDSSHVVSAEVLGQGGSDHNALEAVVDLKPAAQVNV